MDEPLDREAKVRQALELADYRARVADMYGAVRGGDDGLETWSRWVDARDRLLSTHPQSPLVGSFLDSPLPYFDHDPSWRLTGVVEAEPGDDLAIEERDGSVRRFERLGVVDFDRDGQSYRLPIYWADSYGGGWFLPFRDATSGDTTFGSGRYLIDGAKGADLGTVDGRLVLDFNYAYHPSCVWGDWLCPLPTAEARLDLAVTVGERSI